MVCLILVAAFRSFEGSVLPFPGTAVSLAVSALLLGMSDRMGAGLAGVLLFNMTMPVTLSTLYRKFPEYPAASFGILTFALYLGVLPVFAGVPEWMRSPASYTILTVISLVLITVGLCFPLHRRKINQLYTRNRREMA